MHSKSFIVAVALLSGLTVAAQQQPERQDINGTSMEKDRSFGLAIQPDKSQPAFALYVTNPAQSKLNLQITHQEAGVLVDTTITSSQFNRRYNFESLEDGVYTVTVDNGKERVVKAVGLNTVINRIVRLQ